MTVSILDDDLDSIAKCEYISFDKMKNSTVLVTGATGLIGSLLVKTLHYVNRKHQLHLSIIAIVRDAKHANDVLQGYDVQVVEHDIRYLDNIDENIDYIFHCAAVTASKKMIIDPIGNIETAVNGTQNILNLAKKSNVKSIVYTSSMEVYGAFGEDLYEVSEQDMGYIELTNPRSCYSEGKRMCECMCNCYYSQYKLPVKIARLAQTFGAGVSFSENKVFAQFAKSVMKKEDIILHTNGDSYGNYCYTADVIRALLLLLLDGENGQCYNVSYEENTMTIMEMAELVATNISNEVSKIKIEEQQHVQDYGYAPSVKIKLLSKKLKDLGWYPTVNVIGMYKRMILYWEEQVKS